MKDLKKEAEEAATKQKYHFTLTHTGFIDGYLAAAEKHSQQWISVDDRLPEAHAPVIVCDDELEIDSCTMWADGVFHRTRDSSIVKDVTHWRPKLSTPFTP